MSSRLISTLEGCDILLYSSDNKDELVKFVAKAAIDRDGSEETHANEKGTPYYDPDFRPDTSLHIAGKPLDPYTVPFIVVPPVVCKKTANIVLGSVAFVQNTQTYDWCLAVVGDTGPTLKVGEMSTTCARLVGLDDSPTHGGTDKHIIQYVIYVGVPARINGVQYTLQRYGA